MKLMTVTEFAPLVGLKPHTIQNMISDGRLGPPVVVWVLGHARIDWDSFAATHIKNERPVNRRSKPPGRLRVA
jgi:hypothetical protein